MAENNIIFQGYIELYNIYKVNTDCLERKFRGYSFPRDFTVLIKSIYFKTDKDEMIEFNISVDDNYPDENNIEFKIENEETVVISTGIALVHVPVTYLRKFTKLNKLRKGFYYEIDIINSYTGEKLTNDCIEIDYPYKMYISDCQVVQLKDGIAYPGHEEAEPHPNKNDQHPVHIIN